MYLCKGPHSLPHQTTKTVKNKFCIDIPLENTSAGLNKLLDDWDKFYEEMRAAKEMSDQFLVRDLPFGNVDVGRCRSIVSPNNSSRHFHCVLPSENLTEAVDCCVSMFKDISRVMALNLFIRSITSRSGLGVIKMQE